MEVVVEVRDIVVIGEEVIDPSVSLVTLAAGLPDAIELLMSNHKIEYKYKQGMMYSFNIC